PADLPAVAGKTLIRVDDVEAAIAALLAVIAPGEDLPPVGIHGSAVVAQDAELAPDVAVGPCVVIGGNARIGRGTVLCAGVKIGRDAVVGENCVLAEGAVLRYGCVLGNRVRIGCNSVIGQDGYGYFFRNGVHNKIIHAGNVVVEDDVEIGACSCVDRAKWGSTRIGAGTKIDNLVQVAHNVQIGRGSLLVAQTGIAGSAKIGNYVVLGGGAGVRDNITVGDGVQCAAHSAIAQSVDAGKTVAGTPAKDAREIFRELLALPKLPDLLKQVRKMEKQIQDFLGH
ncbi:MAG TPA: UDP-3-O-(3-hydroxymyristoyl)glucosamine N-acyltransferase, partial [Phycisphaerae bacterium]|nr:UDP-3-O-(3-hydroxymyristoyl)glucosamine N-acyltransferase [Phycisphaerae bacterium]